MKRVRSVLVVDRSPASSILQALEQAGWICGHAPDLISSLAVLRQVRPALLLVVTTDGTRSQRAVRALRQDPLMAGVLLVLTEEAARELPFVDAERVQAGPDLAANLSRLLAQIESRPLSVGD